MPVTEIVIIRHAHRQTWVVDTIDGEYQPSQLNPTRIATDPTLSQYGMKQSEEVGLVMKKLLLNERPDYRIAIFLSPFYRCLEILVLTVARLR